MAQFFSLLFGFWQSIYDLLCTITFDLGGISVDYGSLIVGFLFTGMIIAVFWKGART